MRAGKSAFALCLMLLAVALSGCNTSVNEMLDSYNSKFTVGYANISPEDSVTVESLSPGEEGFTEADMLRDEYFVFMESTLILAGPPKNVNSYSWTMYDPEHENERVFVTTVSGSTTEQYFIIYLPKSGLEAGNTYKLTLTIKSTGGETYTDSCSIVVYSRYVYDE